MSSLRRLHALVGLALLSSGSSGHTAQPIATSGSTAAIEERSFGGSFAVLEASRPAARVAVAIAWPDWSGSGEDGRVLLVSAADGSLVREYAVPGLAGFGETVAAVGDIDGDGREDLAVAIAPPDGDQPPAVLVHSAKSDEPLHVWKAGRAIRYPRVALTAAGDLDGDGRVDLAYCFSGFGAEHERVGCRVVARSGRTGEVLFELIVDREGFRCTRIHAVGDVDGDSKADLAITAEGSHLPEAIVELVSGATGETFLTLEGDGRHALFGWSVCVVPDLDGDGRVDLAIGSWDFDGAGEGRVTLHSSADGRVLGAHASKREGFGRAVAFRDHVERPAGVKLLVGADETGIAFGSVAEVALPEGHERVVVIGDGSDHHVGSTIVPAPDLNADGVDDFLIGNDHRQGGAPGRIRVVSGASYETLRLFEPAAYRGK